MHRCKPVLPRLRVEREVRRTAAATVLQAFGRMKRHRLNFLDRRAATVVLQCMYRKHFNARRDWLAVKNRQKVVLGEMEDGGVTEDVMVRSGVTIMPRSKMRRYIR